MITENLSEMLCDLGFVFTQPEFCTKGSFYVVLDCYPYIAECDHDVIEFKTFQEFSQFYEKYK